MSSTRHKVTSASIFLLAAAFIGLLVYGLSLDQKKVPPANIDKPALPFTVAWIQGQQLLPQAAVDQLSLSDLKGKPIVLNFWASWCVSCRQEAHELERFYQLYKSEVAVVGIAIQDEQEAAAKFAQYFGKSYMLGLDVNGKAAIDYGVAGVPETFLIDRQGIVRHKEVGPVTVSMLKQLLPKIL